MPQFIINILSPLWDNLLNTIDNFLTSNFVEFVVKISIAIFFIGILRPFISYLWGIYKDKRFMEGKVIKYSPSEKYRYEKKFTFRKSEKNKINYYKNKYKRFKNGKNNYIYLDGGDALIPHFTKTTIGGKHRILRKILHMIFKWDKVKYQLYLD